MTNDLKNFLEEENKIFYELIIQDLSSFTCEQYEIWLKDHDNRLINKVLDEAKNKIIKKMLEVDDHLSPQQISTIIDNLKVK